MGLKKLRKERLNGDHSDSDSAISSSGPTVGIDSSSVHSSNSNHNPCNCTTCRANDQRIDETVNSPESLTHYEVERSNEMTGHTIHGTTFEFDSFATTEPTCSASMMSLEKKPKLHRIGEKLKKFLTPRDEHYNRQFQRLFVDYLNLDEDLIASFNCLYHDPERKVPLTGRLFVSSMSLAFNSSSAPSRFVLPFDNIFRINKEQQNSTTKANGIRIVLDDGVTCHFGSFGSCEKVYSVILHQWKLKHNAVDGREVGREISKSKMNIEMGVNQTTNDSHVVPTDTASQTSHNTDDTSQSCEPANCECTDHKGHNLLDAIYPLSANQMFQFLFTDNENMREFLKIAKRTDVNYETWSDAGESIRKPRQKKKRTSKYTVELSNTWGPKACDVTEQQLYTEFGPQAINGFMMEKEISNSGIPYADSFCYRITLLHHAYFSEFLSIACLR
ncbi:hypothetical protein M3Y94_00593700 [Aphelenchoides besseyi]|nr:hypothetical protein M3Y94_00593700 [Aphelenchoides besseyi]